MDTTESIDTKATTFEHAECVGEAAIEILGSACGVQLEPQECDENLGSDGVVIGVISIVGDVEWSIFFGLPKVSAMALAAKFAGFEIPFDSEDMGDAVGELTNILAGEIKRRLAGKSVAVTIALPSVIRAESIHVLNRRDTSAVKMCYSCEAGKLWTGVISPKEGGFIA